MPNVSDVYPSQYLNANDLAGKRHRVKIATVEEIEVPDFDDKTRLRKRLLISFVGGSKKMILGARNANILADAIDNNCDKWVGQTIELFAQRENVAGAMKDVLKVSSVQEITAAEDGPGF